MDKKKNRTGQRKAPPARSSAKQRVGAPQKHPHPQRPAPQPPEVEEGRNPNPCPLYHKCGGCQLQNMDYPRQLAWKQAQVQRLLGKYCHVEPILSMEDPYHYRNKVQAAFAMTRDKRVISGVYQSSTHKVVRVDRCMTEDQIADRIIVDIRRMLLDHRILPYNEDSGQGLLRHVLVRRGFASGQIMVVLVLASPIFPAKKRFVAALLEKHPEITTILMNVNAMHTSMVLGEREQVLYGPGYIEDTLCGCVFRISAKSFYQINPLQTETLYGRAMELAGLTGKERVIDAYCGIGTIGLIASRSAGEVIGVELNRDAVKDAISNCRRNGIQNARFYAGDAGDFMTRMAQEGETADVVFMDPPRAGSDQAFLTALTRLGPEKVVYISCNPETQARDFAFLTTHGYKVTHIQPVDMFPHTNHVETCTLLQKSETEKRGRRER